MEDILHRRFNSAMRNIGLFTSVAVTLFSLSRAHDGRRMGKSPRIGLLVCGMLVQLCVMQMCVYTMVDMRALQSRVRSASIRKWLSLPGYILRVNMVVFAMSACVLASSTGVFNRTTTYPA
jgi:hypothetical protein